jgi:predicted nucleic acid-binding protein
MKTLFLDTGYLIAVEASDDQNHQAALLHWQKLIKSQPRIITTTFVFDEIVTFFNNRNRHAKAIEIGKNLLESNLIEIIQVNEELLDLGWDYFQKHDDKRYSLTDCISFIVMEERNLTTALTFDKHFTQAGFVVLPKDE